VLSGSVNRRGDIVIEDNVGAHGIAGVRDAVGTVSYRSPVVRRRLDRAISSQGGTPQGGATFNRELCELKALASGNAIVLHISPTPDMVNLS
jgi:hypothetical protein